MTESRKRKQKNWEDDDFYDSDEDLYLDRTGDIEKKRKQRMKKAGKMEGKTETYQSLVSKSNSLVNSYLIRKEFGKHLSFRKSCLKIYY